MIWQLPTDACNLEIDRHDPGAQSSHVAGTRALLIRLGVSLCLSIATAYWLHQPWIPLVWLVLIAIWVGHYWREAPRVRIALRDLMPILGVMVVASVTRVVHIDALPQGPYIDEILLYLHVVEQYHNPIDLFGQTVLSDAGWVQVANLHLYFCWLVLQLVGPGYFGLKMISVIPGIVTALAFYLTCRQLWQPRVALWAGLLFACSHWPVRFSRYGGGGSFALMAFAVSIWILVLALRGRGHLFAWLSGFASGLSMYGYVAGRMCVGSLLAFLALELILARSRAAVRRMTAFAGGLFVAALPIVCIYLAAPETLGVRASELSIFGHPNWFALFLSNLWGHLGMFHVQGGLYARDNYPGLPMLDIVSGVLFLAGLVFMLRRPDLILSRLLACALVVNMVGGLLSVSQEGAPYVLRVSAVMLPALLLVAMGLQWTSGLLERKKPDSKWSTWFPACLITPACALNLWLYFGLESKNLAGTRVTAYEIRLLIQEVDRYPEPVVLVGGDIFARAQPNRYPEEDHSAANPTFVTGPSTSLAAVHFLSRKFDPWRPLGESLAEMRRRRVELGTLERPGRTSPMVAICNARNQALVKRLRGLPGRREVRFVKGMNGRDLFAIFELR